MELAFQEDWDLFISNLDGMISSDLQVMVEAVNGTNIEENSSLLHAICSFPSVPQPVVERILARAPDLVFSRNVNGESPLHCAIHAGCSVGVIQSILKLAPGCAESHDLYGGRAIDILARKLIMKEEHFKYAKKKTGSISRTEIMLSDLWECVRVLAVAMDADETRDWKAPTLHACLQANAYDFPYALLERAMKRFEKDFATRDQYGNMPLHIAAGQSFEYDPNDFYLRGIIERNPDAARQKNCANQLPLNLGIENGHRDWNTGIADLLEANTAPDQFSIQISVLILGLAATRECQTLVFKLLRQKPDFFSHYTSYE